MLPPTPRPLTTQCIFHRGEGQFASLHANSSIFPNPCLCQKWANKLKPSCIMIKLFPYHSFISSANPLKIFDFVTPSPLQLFPGPKTKPGRQKHFYWNRETQNQEPSFGILWFTLFSHINISTMKLSLICWQIKEICSYLPTVNIQVHNQPCGWILWPDKPEHGQQWSASWKRSWWLVSEMTIKLKLQPDYILLNSFFFLTLALSQFCDRFPLS